MLTIVVLYSIEILDLSSTLVKYPRPGAGMEKLERRVFMKGAALSALAFTVGGAQVFLTPRQASAQGVTLRVLTADEQATLEALGDTLLPGAKEAGIAHYVDQQIGTKAGECLLAARALGIPPPYVDFYRFGLEALDCASVKLHGAKFAELVPEKRHDLVDRIRQANPEGWNGPPAPFFYFVTRSDAVDVFYGTVEGFERLGVPYMPHILPERNW
jgi:Gluconate 2-dehydrogenase subunit 3